MRRHTLTNKNTETKTKKTPSLSDPRYLQKPCDLWEIWSKRWGLIEVTFEVIWRHELINKKTNTKAKSMTKTFKEQPQRAIQETCEDLDTRYISDTWEQQSQHSVSSIEALIKSDIGQHLRCFQFMRMWLIALCCVSQILWSKASTQWWSVILVWGSRASLTSSLTTPAQTTSYPQLGSTSGDAYILYTQSTILISAVFVDIKWQHLN